MIWYESMGREVGRAQGDEVDGLVEVVRVRVKVRVRVRVRVSRRAQVDEVHGLVEVDDRCVLERSEAPVDPADELVHLARGSRGCEGI